MTSAARSQGVANTNEGLLVGFSANVGLPRDSEWISDNTVHVVNRDSASGITT